MVVRDEYFIRLLKTAPAKRSDVELRYISYFLQTLTAVNHASQTALHALSRSVYYDCRDRGSLVYNASDVATCWYILLSGAICRDTPNGLVSGWPEQSFGMEVTEDGKRGYACYAMEFSEFIVIDFPNRTICPYTNTEQVTSKFLRVSLQNSMRHSKNNMLLISPNSHKSSQNRAHQYYEQAKSSGAYLNLELMGEKKNSEFLPRVNSMSNRLSISSNGSSFMTSDGESSGSNTKLDELNHIYSQVVKPVRNLPSSVPFDEDYYSELVYYDSCFDELSILKKAPLDRSIDDVKLLADFLQHFTVFSGMSNEMRLDFCHVMKYAHVEQKGTVILHNKEQLDSWCVVINGEVSNTKSDGTKRIFRTGQSFGLNHKVQTPQFHEGTMITLEKDCQFVAIPQKEYLEVIDKYSQYERIVCDGNRTVMITEAREITDSVDDESYVVKMGEPSRLITHLVEDHCSSETTYVEDFLLTYRTFINDPTLISEKLEKWYDDQNTVCMKERVTKAVFVWVGNHYIDFESHSNLSYFLEKFYDKLVMEGKSKETSKLARICGRKGNVRKVELDSLLRKDGLPFNLTTPLGGKGSFIKTFKMKVEGLKVGDQIIAVNNKNVETFGFKEVMDVIFSHEYCWLTVKHNILGMKRIIAKQNSLNIESELCSSLVSSWANSPEIPRRAESVRAPVTNIFMDTQKPRFQKNKLKKMAKRFTFFPPNPLTKMLTNSTSNPDVSSIGNGSKLEEGSDFALKIYTIDQNYKYLSFSELTSIRHIVCKAVEAFELGNPERFVICHVEVNANGMVKQTRLADQHNKDLTDRIRPATRFYIKQMDQSERLLPTESIVDLQKEACVQFLDLKPLELAIQLTLRDLQMVQKISSHQYIEMLWKLPPLNCKYQSYTAIDDFVNLSNKELFWVVHTVCGEKSTSRRAKIIKRFIKIAKFCRELRNFNSMFAILSGLGHISVSRLETTWDKVSSRDHKLKSVLDEVLDPSRNMSRYRNLLSAYKGSSPVIPIFPIFMKDLTVYHLGNESKIDNLINFEKLRLISREIKCFYTSISSHPDRDFLKSLTAKPNRIPPTPAAKTYEENSVECSKSSNDVSVIFGATSKNGLLHKSRKSILSLNNPKKIYEELLMCKRVEQYIKNLEILTNEEELRKLSETCEPSEVDVDLEALMPPPPLLHLESTSSNGKIEEHNVSDNTSALSQDQLSNYDILSLSSGGSSSANERSSVKEPRRQLERPVSQLYDVVAPSEDTMLKQMLRNGSESPGSYVFRNKSQGRSSITSVSSSSSWLSTRSSSGTRADDKQMRIPSTPVFAINKPISVAMKPTPASAISPNRLLFKNSYEPHMTEIIPRNASKSPVSLRGSTPQIGFARNLSLVSTHSIPETSSKKGISSSSAMNTNLAATPSIQSMSINSANSSPDPAPSFWPHDSSLNL